MMPNKLFTEMPKVLYENRYCNQDDFDLIISDEASASRDRNNYKVNYHSSTKVKTLYSTSKLRRAKYTTLTSGRHI